MRDILVITATLGNRESLHRTIDSVKSIGGSRVRHVIVCPESKMSSIITRFGDVECLPEPANGNGIYSALNHGFRTYGKQYKYLTFLNDDDYWLPEFKKLIDVISQNDLDFVYGRTLYVDQYNSPICEQASSPQFDKFLLLSREKIVLLTQQATLIRSEVYFNIGGFDETYRIIADSKFWCEVSKANVKYKYVNAVCAAYMFQKGQLSCDHDTQKIENKKFFSEMGIPTENAFWTVLVYRLYNVPIYIKRFIQNKGNWRNPFGEERRITGKG